MAAGTIPVYEKPWILLWTNPSPSQNFVEQTVALDLSAYTEVRVDYFRETSNTGMHVYTDIVDIVNFNMSQPITIYDLNGHLVRRLMSVETTPTAGLHFSVGWKYASYGTSTEDASLLIPAKIYAR